MHIYILRHRLGIINKNLIEDFCYQSLYLSEINISYHQIFPYCIIELPKEIFIAHAWKPRKGEYGSHIAKALRNFPTNAKQTFNSQIRQ